MPSEVISDICIVIPSLNEELFIASCLESIIRQSCPIKKMDILVIDGCSTDQTHKIVEEYSTQFPNIRLINNPQKIQSAAFNLGVNNSKSKYIIRLDAHASYDKHYIERCIQDLKADPSRGNVGGRCIILPFKDTLWAKANAILNYSRFGIGGSAFRVGTKAGNVDTVPFGAFPREVVEKVGGMREDLRRAEDNEYNSRIRKAGYNVYFDPEIISTYYARPTLKASCKQMFANGESIGHLFYVDRDSIGLRHIIPVLFVMGIIFGTIASFVWHPLSYALCSGLALYFTCDLIASCAAAKKNGWKYMIPLFILFFCVHLSYGCGTIVGLFSGRKLKKNNLSC